MRRAAGWLLGALVLAVMAGGAWLGLRPFVGRETLWVMFGRPEVEPSPSADALASGLRLALEESDYRAGRFRVDLGVSAWPWDQDGPRTVAVLGTSDPGKVLARTNRKSLSLLSATDTDPGYSRLTRDDLETWRPSGLLSFFRLVPTDDVLAAAAARWARKLGALRTFVLVEESMKSALLARYFQDAAPAAGIRLVGAGAADDTPIEEILAAKPDLVFFGGEKAPYVTANRIFGGLRASGYTGKLMAADIDVRVSVLDSPQPPPEGTHLVSPLAPPPEGFAERYRAFAGKEPGPHVYYGYLAGQAILEALARAKAGNREAVRRAFTELPQFDANGDTTTNFPAGYRVEEGKFRFLETLK